MSTIEGYRSSVHVGMRDSGLEPIEIRDIASYRNPQLMFEELAELTRKGPFGQKVELRRSQ